MGLWKMELQKILGRPLLNVGLFLILALQLIAFCSDVSGKQSEIDGNIYKGISAIKADRRLAEEYGGRLILMKVEQIIERFGFSGYRMEDEKKAPRSREGNFCNQWVTDNMTDFFYTEKKPSALKEGKMWQERGQQYFSADLQFGYTAGWSYFHNAEKIYYGGTEEQWESLCTVDRSRIDVVQIICNANPNNLE